MGVPGARSAANLGLVEHFDSCAVCGRSILAGERIHEYLTREGERRTVCELCRARAERAGWIPEEDAEKLAEDRPRRPGGLRSLFGGFGRRREEAAPQEADTSVAEEVQQLEDIPVEQELVEAHASPDPAAPGAHVGRVKDVSESPRGRLERAVHRFNLSEASHTVAGLMRTLGEPWVSVGASAGTPSEVRITVAWELSWYQWGVDLRDELRPVFPLDKGNEIDQLDVPARQWNATAADGQVFLGAPVGGLAADGEPVG